MAWRRPLARLLVTLPGLSLRRAADGVGRRLHHDPQIASGKKRQRRFSLDPPTVLGWLLFAETTRLKPVPNWMGFFICPVSECPHRMGTWPVWGPPCTLSNRLGMQELTRRFLCYSPATERPAEKGLG